MYPKVKTVRRGGRSYEYLELVEGRREGGRVRQHVVANLGRLDELVAGGQLEQLAAGLARLHQPPPGTRRHAGPLLVVAHYLRALDATVRWQFWQRSTGSRVTVTGNRRGFGSLITIDEASG